MVMQFCDPLGVYIFSMWWEIYFFHVGGGAILSPYGRHSLDLLTYNKNSMGAHA